jgi:DNA-binding response OmpR family regulator
MVGLGFIRLIAEYSAELVHLRDLNPRERSDVPVIMLSAKDTEVDKAVGLELGADDYVTKPFTCRGLAAWIEAMRHSPGADQSTSFVKPFQLCRPPHPS